ncbi:DMT family transporter [Treponema peruense]|uniref:DMT family transporter n=1 Tax=Treponema peruense TaxID=2787628 RepID=A0A7T3REH1_9SPIR|nr:DMT family transporter [Treponema peruense]QQA01619.1 DMT family transporter [Treponema peruense]
MKKQALPYILAAFCILVWGVSFICTKYLLRTFSSLEILILRFVTGYIAFCIISPKPLKTSGIKEELLFMGAGLCGITIYQFVENIAIYFTAANNVSIIVSTCPMFTAIIAAIFLHEKTITKNFVLGFVIAMTGIVLVTLNGSSEFSLSPKGDLLALGSAICWGFYSLFVSKINSLGHGNFASTRRIFFWALIFMIPLAVYGLVFGGKSTSINFCPAENTARWSDWKNILNLVILGVFASSLAFVAWNKTCKALGTVKTTAAIYMVCVVTIIFSFIFLGEKISLAGLFGTFLTILGLFISEKKQNKNINIRS